MTYTVQSYDGQLPRNGSITIAGKSFTVTQNGIDIILTPEADSVSCAADVTEIGVHALASTHWQVLPQTNWITVVSPGNGYGDDTVVIAAEENPSYYPRTGYVRIGSATFRLTQKGNDNVIVSISPESVNADPSGAYGDIAVDITPVDAPWYAESRTSWLTVAEGSNGDGPGVIRYVASPNSTYADREGIIKVLPIMQRPDPDYYAGLIWQTTNRVQYSDGQYHYIDYNSTIRESLCSIGDPTINYYGTNKYERSFSYPKDENDFSFSFDFSVNEINRVNRFVSMNNHSIYINDDNRLYVDALASSWIIENSNTIYTVLIKQSTNGVLRTFVGIPGGRLSCVLSAATEQFFDFSQQMNWSFGYTQHPSPGYLIVGRLMNFKFWARELSEDEALRFCQGPWELHDKCPAFMPACTKWLYFPMDENYVNSHSGLWQDIYDAWTEKIFSSKGDRSGSPNRFGVTHKAITLNGDGRIGPVNSVPYSREIQNAAFLVDGANCMKNRDEPKYWYTALENWSFSFWACPQMLYPDSGQEICRVFHDGNTNSVRLTDHSMIASHYVRKDLENREEFLCAVTPNEWMMFSGVIRNSRSLTLYINGNEIGNTEIWQSGKFTEFYLYSALGKLDDLFFCDAAMTSEEVHRLYQATRMPTATHHVLQGYIEPALTETNMVVNVDGGTTNVGLSIGSRVAWTATENVDWLHITSPKSGTGPAIMTFDFDANPRVEERIGTLTIADVVLTVRQKGLLAEVEADTTIAEVDGGYGFVTVTTEADALWSATSHADWLTIVDGEESQGVGLVMWVADPYTDSTHSRIGSMTVAAHKIYITQRGYELSVSTNGVEVSSSSANGQIDVSSPPGTEWTVMATEPWVTITSGDTGVGKGTVRYTVADNTTGSARTGSIIVSGEEYVITQTSTVEVKAQIAGKGSVTGTGNYEQHAVVELVATPDDGYVFSHWSGDVNGNTNRLSVTADTSKNAIATFIPVAAADQIAADRGGVAEGMYTRDQIHALEIGNLVLDVDSTSGTARLGVRLMETSDLSVPNWKPVGLTTDNLDVGTDGSVGLNVPADQNTKFFKVVVPDNN